MPDKFETKFSNYFKLPNPGLRAYFQHVVEGQPDEYRTPFFKSEPLVRVLSEWTTHLSKLKDSYPDLYKFEIDLGKKVGPMSIMKPLSERMKDIDAYYDLISLDQVPVDKYAILAAFNEWKHIAGMRHRSQNTTVDNMKKSTNSGSPYFRKRSTVTKDTLPCDVYQRGISTEQFLKYYDEWLACATLGWRGQEGGPDRKDVKQRVVWMFPYAVNIEELSVYQPLVAAIQKSRTLIPAWVGLNEVDLAITRMFDTKSKSDYVICTDFEKFDQHFNPTLQSVARQSLDYLFAGDPYMESWLNDVFPIKYAIPLAFDYGKIRTGDHGMASGSGGTNADETLVHRVLQHEAALKHGSELNPHSQCLGDDGVLTYPGISVDDVVQTYCSHGLEMNEDKQYVSKHDCTYLRRWHHQDYRVDNVCVGVYATTRALGRLCEQERYYDPDSWGPKMVALRQLSILENVRYHPLAEEFVDFCMKGDKFRLGLDIPGFLDDVERIAQEAIDYMPDFLGYTRSLESDGNPASTGISNWWIVKLLKSKA